MYIHMEVVILELVDGLFRGFVYKKLFLWLWLWA